MSIAIRNGDAGDLDSVIEVMNAAFEPSFGERWTRSQCAGILPMAGVALRIAEGADGPPVGFTLMRAVAGEAELLLIAVDPSAQRGGIGRALLEDFIVRARSAGASQLHLEVRDGNAALSLYDSAGFELIGRRTDYYRGPEGDLHDALTLQLKSHD